MRNKKAFTLIELLAVIVILAIIALIAMPVIMNIINKANKSAFKDTVYGIISAGELYFAEQQLNPLGMSDDVTIELPDTTKKLELKGEVPTGSITITKEGKISLAVSNKRYCVTKDFDDKDVTVTEEYKKCKNPALPNTLTDLATEETGVTKPACLTDGTQCTAGTPVAIKVNETETYNFYVISETNNELALIMDRNLGDNVKWYTSSGNSHGPTTAVATLKERTSGWTNIPEKEYTYSDDGGGNRYTAFTETMRARMLTYTEATTTFGCKLYASNGSSNGSCPSWLYINLNNTGSDTDNAGNHRYGYWTPATGASLSIYASIYAFYVSSGGYLNSINTNYSNYGIRPVIELTK